MIPSAAFAVVALLAAAVGIFGRELAIRAAGYCVLVVLVIAVWFSALGHARPAPLPGLGTPSGTVVAYRLDEPRAIYVWLAIKGSIAPLALQLPWSESRAAALIQAEAKAKRRHGSVMMRGRAGHTRGRNGARGQQGPMFYPAPPAPLPDKEAR